MAAPILDFTDCSLESIQYELDEVLEVLALIHHLLCLKVLRNQEFLNWLHLFLDVID